MDSTKFSTRTRLQNFLRRWNDDDKEAAMQQHMRSKHGRNHAPGHREGVRPISPKATQ